ELDERARVKALGAMHETLDVIFVDAEVRAPDAFDHAPLPDDPALPATAFAQSRVRVMREAAASGHRCVLDGEGGDEVFDLAVAWPDLLAWGSLGAAARQLVRSRNRAALLWRQTIVPRL